MTLDEFTDQFFDYVSNLIDEQGISPWPMFALGADGKLVVAMIADCTADVGYRHFWNQVAGFDPNMPNPQFVIMGMDRTTRPNQGTEFADVLTCVCWRDDPEAAPGQWGRALKFGVINYQHDPRIVRPWDWDNAFWTDAMRKEALHYRPAFRIKIEKR